MDLDKLLKLECIINNYFTKEEKMNPLLHDLKILQQMVYHQTPRKIKNSNFFKFNCKETVAIASFTFLFEILFLLLTLFICC